MSMWYKVGLLTALIAVVTLPAGLLTLLFVGFQAGLTVFIIGWLFFVPVLPLSVGIYRALADSGEDPDNEATALAELKRRYAAGDLGEEEFVDRLERLLELEGIEREDVDGFVEFADERGGSVDAVPRSELEERGGEDSEGSAAVGTTSAAVATERDDPNPTDPGR